jgi:archaellum biogenesis protein FlaJ (TadC family)
VAHVLKDLLMGSTIVLAGMLLSLAASIVFLILWLFFHLLGPLLCVFFFIFLFFFALWLIGFVYRKARETVKK